MSNGNLRLFATDKDLFDLLIAPRQKITERIMLELARDRRIFCSSRASRHELADYISSLPHDFQDVAGLIEKGEASTRNERTTFVTVEAEGISEADIRAALNAYKTSVGTSERVTAPPSGAGVVLANIEYSEFDYSRTHLLQRQNKSAGIEFRLEDGQVRVRLPSTERAQEIVAAIVFELERNKRSTFARSGISVSHLKPELRSRFFLNLMRRMDGYRADTVTRLKVSSSNSSEIEDADGEDVIDGASAEMLHLVKNVALTGQNLLASAEYRQLAESGFFITSMTWRASQQVAPHDKIQFDVSFEDGEAGTGFRYLVRVAQKSTRDTYPQSFRLPTDARKKELFQTIEQTAHAALAELETAAAVAGAGSDA
ncbi:hypothetical protein [Rhizobium binae]|uniref:hypothetical protein n=1 Tax=Rhizobium binae TaxID=1138190 RepID=UPI001C8288DE|nr:hypothetical protein [Rhizobium binae]MBX4961371.1 hypothetical protein [Rhizobium binae]